MSEKDKIVVEFVEELLRTPQTMYEEVRAVLMAVEAGNEKMSNFLRRAFEVAEEHRPKLLEMKGGVTV